MDAALDKFIEMSEMLKSFSAIEYWCIHFSVTIDKPETVSIYQVKKTDKDTFKKKASWRFRDLKTIDGKDATKVC